MQLCSVGAASGQDRWLEDVAQAVRDAVDDLGEDDIVAVGLGVPRLVDPHTGQLVPPVLPPWKEGDDPAQMLADELSRRIGQRLLAPTVVLDNDANLAAYAQSIYEFDQAETLIGIKASTGIGAGIVVGGKIFRGARGGGEIGHVVVQPGGKFCTCGGRGCLESVIGADALIEQVTTTLGHRRLQSEDLETLDALVQMAKDGNVGYQRVLREAGRRLGSLSETSVTSSIRTLWYLAARSAGRMRLRTRWNHAWPRSGNPRCRPPLMMPVTEESPST